MESVSRQLQDIHDKTDAGRKIGLMFRLRPTSGQQGTQRHKRMSPCTWNAIVRYGPWTKLLRCVFICIHISTSPYTSLLKSVIYGNGTSALLWALCGRPRTQTHIQFRASLREPGRVNRWHQLYPLYRLPNTHTCTVQQLALWVHLI